MKQSSKSSLDRAISIGEPSNMNELYVRISLVRDWLGSIEGHNEDESLIMPFFSASNPLLHIPALNDPDELSGIIERSATQILGFSSIDRDVVLVLSRLSTNYSSDYGKLGPTVDGHDILAEYKLPRLIEDSVGASTIQTLIVQAKTRKPRNRTGIVSCSSKLLLNCDECY